MLRFDCGGWLALRTEKPETSSSKVGLRISNTESLLWF
jgi:hypothetical protein